MDRPPFFVSVAPGDGVYGAGSLIQESVVFGDSDMACPMGHVTDFLTLSYYLIPEPVASSPELVDNGDGSGLFQWTPAEEDEGSYTLGLVATDIYGLSDTVEVSLGVCAQPGYLDYSYRLQLRHMCAFSGEQIYYPVYLTNPEPVAGYEILIAYDSSCLNLQNVVENVIGGYTSEYFAYNPIQPGVVDSFPAVRVVALRDMANATYTPPFPPDTDQVLFYLVFDVYSDVPPNRKCDIKFIVNEAGDNSLSDTSGLVLHVPVILDVAVQNSDSGYCPFEEYFVGMGDSSAIAWDMALVDGFDWVEGWTNCDPLNPCPLGLITVNPALIGDINLNGDRYEIGDVVFFNKYLLGCYIVDDDTLTPPVGWTLQDWGQSRINSDINMNGFYYEMGDLVLLTAVINGYINPPAAKIVNQDGGVVKYSLKGNRIYIKNDEEISAIYLRIKLDRDVKGPIFGEVTEGMLRDWNIIGNELRILILSLDNKSILPGEWNLLEIPGDVYWKIVEFSAGTPKGALLKVIHTDKSDLQFTGVFPNPLREKATIKFVLGKKEHANIKIYDVSGKIVKRLDLGKLEAGEHAVIWDRKTNMDKRASSGIYFVEIEAGLHRAVRKVILMK
ncbi:MAG: hypothetical protein DRQ06_03685 [Candidatus Hydrothermota bacterium]|nr:MAG: hypothetical protein DRQ06_03685 [Candidatus Hydrothermae bacterium]